MQFILYLVLNLNMYIMLMQSSAETSHAPDPQTPMGSARDRSSFSPFSPQSPLSPAQSDRQSLSSSVASTSKKIIIPDHWRQETETCIEKRALDSDARCDISRTLVTLLVVKFGPKVSSAQCQDVARQLILKYRWMADDMGTGYVCYSSFSFLYFMSLIVMSRV